MSIVPVTKYPIAPGAHVVVRSSLNVPMRSDHIVKSFRLDEALRTIQFLIRAGARTTVIGHLGREQTTLRPVHEYLSRFVPVTFVPDLTGKKAYKARRMLVGGDVLLLENTRSDPREEAGDSTLADELVHDTDVFVFDAFPVSHRVHASTVPAIKRCASCVGMRFHEEYTALRRMFERLEHPAVAILGGAKCETKLPLLKELLQTYDTVFAGGVLANILLRHGGMSVGSSPMETLKIPESLLKKNNLLLPSDVTVMRDGKTQIVSVGKVSEEDVIVDVGPKSIAALQEKIKNARTVLWNGPLGVYEQGHIEHSLMLSRIVGESGAYAVVGGGDTVSLLGQHDCLGDWSFVSTGGGALIYFLTHKTLPVLEAFGVR